MCLNKFYNFSSVSQYILCDYVITLPLFERPLKSISRLKYILYTSLRNHLQERGWRNPSERCEHWQLLWLKLKSEKISPECKCNSRYCRATKASPRRFAFQPVDEDKRLRRTRKTLLGRGRDEPVTNRVGKGLKPMSDKGGSWSSRFANERRSRLLSLVSDVNSTKKGENKR